MIEGQIAFAAALGVKVQGGFKFVGDAEVIDDQAALFLEVDAVDPGDRLHQVVAFHRFVDVHGVKTGGVEPGEPHVADDHEFEFVGGVFEALGEDLAVFLGGVVLDEVAFIGGAGGHDDFEFAAVEVVAVPVGAELDQVFVEVGGDATAEGDDHAFAAIGGLALLEVGDDVLGDRP